MHVWASYYLVLNHPVHVYASHDAHSAQGVLAMEDVIENALEIVRVVSVLEFVEQVVSVARLEPEVVFEELCAVLVSQALSVSLLQETVVLESVELAMLRADLALEKELHYGGVRGRVEVAHHHHGQGIRALDLFYERINLGWCKL